MTAAEALRELVVRAAVAWYAALGTDHEDDRNDDLCAALGDYCFERARAHIEGNNR